MVVDVLRATTVIPAGLAAGATAFFPTTTVDEARALRQRMHSALLCGERDGIAPAGFDLGNSPLEYTSDRVRGRDLVFTSTNGASALLRLRGARQIVTAAFVNAGAVARAIVSREEDVLLVASGKAGRSCLEDTAGCGSVGGRSW